MVSCVSIGGRVLCSFYFLAYVSLTIIIIRSFNLPLGQRSFINPFVFRQILGKKIVILFFKKFSINFEIDESKNDFWFRSNFMLTHRNNQIRIINLQYQTFGDNWSPKTFVISFEVNFYFVAVEFMFRFGFGHLL